MIQVGHGLLYWEGWFVRLAAVHIVHGQITKDLLATKFRKTTFRIWAQKNNCGRSNELIAGTFEACGMRKAQE